MAITAPVSPIRDFFSARGGEAPLGELYAHMAGRAAASTVRETSRTVEAMLKKGELKEASPGLYRLSDLPETRGQKGKAHNRLWRALHQRCERNGRTTSAELAALTGVGRDSVQIWLRVMEREHRINRSKADQAVIYLAGNQPGPESPPPFRWPRRGKAKTRKDLQGES